MTRRKASTRQALGHTVIRASAGTGKTFALSNRYLQLLARGAAPSSILAITFTRKAAGEILARVLRRLACGATSRQAAAQLTRELNDPDLTPDVVNPSLNRLCASLHRVAISTIDSFFHRVAGAYRAELGLPRSLLLTGHDDARVHQIRLDAIDALLGDDDLDTMLDLLRRLNHGQVRRNITDALEDIVSQLHEVYLQTDPEAWRGLKQPTGRLNPTQQAEAIEALANLDGYFEDQKAWAKAWQGDLSRALERDWIAFLEQGIAAAVRQGRNTYGQATRELPLPVRKVYQRLVNHAVASVLAGIVHRTAAMHDLLQRYDEHHRRLSREAGLMLFSEVPVLLEKGLTVFGDDPDAQTRREELYYRLDGRIQHMLLDEFQDTSPSQWHVLAPLAREIAASEGRSFFCVGDLKQAIYGWRGGSAAIFDRVESELHLPQDRTTLLNVSWRSSPFVLEVVNRVFERLDELPPLANLREPVASWARNFHPHQAARPNLPGYVEIMHTRVRTDEDEPESGDETSAALTPHLAAVVQRLCELRERCAGRSIGVLVRRNLTAAAIVQGLIERGVEASGEGGTCLTDDAAVTTILAALQLADHPGDTAAAYQLLNGPLGPVLGLTGVDSHHLAAVSRSIRRRLIDQGPATVVADWSRQMAGACSPRHVRRLNLLVEFLDGLELGRSLRVRDLIRQITSASVEAPTSATMRVMTIHKAKGLEFDVVVLPELNERIGEVNRLPLWTHRPDPTSLPTFVVAPVPKNLLDTAAEHDPRIAEARAQEQSRRVHDDLCSLYVAMTRARHALHLLIPPVARTKNGLSKKGLHDESMTAILRHALLDPEDEKTLTQPDHVVFRMGCERWSALAPVTAKPPESSPRPLSLRLRAGGPDSRRSWVSVSPSSLADEGTVRASHLLQLAEDPALARGSAIHALFQQVEWIDETPPPVPADHPLRETFLQMLNQPKVRAALSRRGRAGLELWRERGFSLHVEGRLLRGQFDRVELDRAAQRARILDFKTDRHSEAAVARYQPQMEAYRQALARLLGWEPSRVEVMLLFVTDGRVAAM